MNYWDILALAPTTDEIAIKKAYRTQIRRHHPEDDPEGFQKVRQAYEAALQYCQQAIRDISSHVRCSTQTSEATQTPVALQTQFEECTIQSLLENVNHLIQDATQRLSVAPWQDWIEKCQQCTIQEQETISNQTIQLVLQHRWLPGDIINLLWHGLGWSMLLRGHGKQVETAEHLDAWRSQHSMLPLAQLAACSHAEQRAQLGWFRAFQTAWDWQHLPALKYVLNLPVPRPYFSNIEYAFCIVHASLQDPSIVSPTIQQHFCDQLLQALPHLSVPQLHQLGRAMVTHHRSDDVHKVCQQLAQHQAFMEIAEIQYEYAQHQGTGIAETAHVDYLLGFAFLYQHWASLPIIFWRSERHCLQTTDNADQEKRHQWIYNHLIQRPDHHFETTLDFYHQTGMTGDIFKAFWLGQYGSWAEIQSIQNQLQQYELSSNQQSYWLIQVTQHYLQCVLQEAESSAPTLFERFLMYGSVELEHHPVLTQTDVAQLPCEAWRDWITRHPFIPDTWFSQLVEADAITTTRLAEMPLVPSYIDALCYYRCIDPEYKIASPWHETHFEGCFLWATAYYSQLSTLPIDNTNVLEQLPALPAFLSHSPLGAFLPFIESPEDFLPAQVSYLADFPDQFVFRYITHHQVKWLKQHCHQEQIVELAYMGEPIAYCALVRLMLKTHLEEAIIYWNLLAIVTKTQPQFRAELDWLQQSLLKQRDLLGYYQAEYSPTDTDIIYWMLTPESSHFDNPNTVCHLIPEPAARHYHYPLYYLITLLHQQVQLEQSFITQKQHESISPAHLNNTDDLSPLKDLSYKRTLQTVEQQQATDIALAMLERQYQRLLILTSPTPSKPKTYHPLSIFHCLIGIAVGWTLFDVLMPEFSHDFLSVSQIILCVLVTQQLNSSDMRRYFISLAMCFTVLIWIEAVFSTLMITGLLIHFIFSQVTTRLCIRGRWNKKLLDKQSRISLKRFLSMTP